MSLVVNNNLMAANVARNLNAHYGRLQTSTQRLSSGLRVNSAADDAAGLAIRELQRADIAALHQGARNANDAISLIQVADGSLGVIDEKLIRMKELAEQAATGTYSSTQRLMIESEYQAMASEITRIANATDFNGIKLLDGTLSSLNPNDPNAKQHDGSGLTSVGSLKVHFGTGNDSAEDYYYVTIGNCTASALGVGNNAWMTTTTIVDTINGEEVGPKQNGYLNTAKNAVIPDTDIYTDYTYTDGAGATVTVYSKDGISFVDLNGADVTATIPGGTTPTPGTGTFMLDGGAIVTASKEDYYVGKDTGNIYDAVNNPLVPKTITTKTLRDGGTVSTQEAAQKALDAINNAIESKDKIRAHLGAMQNRLENTVTNLNIQAENLQAAESRISDVDVATEMTQFVRNQILTQSAVAMLGQANSLPQMAMQLIGG